MPDRLPRPLTDRDTATWGLIDAWDDEADTAEQKLTALAPWVQQLTEIMTAVEPTDGHDEADPLSEQVKRLADAIVAEIPGEPSQSEGAIDTAIRLLRGGIPTNADAAYWFEKAQRADRERDDWKRWCEEHEAEIERLRALVGGRSAAPTRDEVQEAIYDTYVAAVKPPSFLTVASMWQLTDAVVALLSRSAAEPPGPGRNELLRLLDHFDRYVSSPDQTDYVDTPFYDEIQAALAGYRSADGVAAEPNEDHGVRWVHPGCEKCKQVAVMLTGHPSLSDEDDTTERWRKLARWWLDSSGVAAEPNEEHDDGE